MERVELCMDIALHRVRSYQPHGRLIATRMPR
ncbi:hypothetical protein MTBSS4_210083 [Magnetospirillum sp. SS-4]|nr:hypothetical protein MTBSS4_210083 [Magnetospirillum sp. SS-4]